MPREVYVGRVHSWLVATVDGDGALELVADHRARHPAEKSQRADLRSQKIRNLLRRTGLGIREIGGAQRRDKQLALHRLPGLRIGVHGLVAGVVDKQLIARPVRLPHDRAARRDPESVMFTEGGATKTVGRVRLVLLIKKLDGDALFPQLQVQLGPVWLRPERSCRRRGRG